jgi:hypothetical protein
MSLTIALCGIPIEVDGARAPNAQAALAEACARFASPQAPRWTLRWNEEGGEATPGDAPIAVESSGSGISIRAGGFFAQLRPTSRQGELSGRALGAADACLLSILAHEDPWTLPLHASAVQWEDGAVDVFCGPSESGKSTLARELGRDERALCDEIVVLRLEGGRVIVHSTPFWRGRPGQGPLRGLYLLGRGPLRKRPLSPKEVLTRLLPETRIMLPAEIARARALEQLARLLAIRGASELCFGLADLPGGVRSLLDEEGA